MKDSMEVLKKIGAFIIVLLLIIMMAITFSSQPIDEIVMMISGASKVGSFQKEPILVKDYSLIHEECNHYFQKYGFTDVPPALLQSCIYQQIVQLYVKPVIATDLGLNVSKESIENQIIESVKQAYQLQQKNVLPEDRISIEELYTRETNYFPIYKRVALTKASLLDNFLLNPVLLGKEDLNTLKNLFSNRILLKTKILIFSNEDLLKNIKIEVSEEEIQKKYEEDKKEHESNPQNKEAYPSLKERYTFIKEKLANEKKRLELSRIKEELGKIVNLQNFEELTKILHIEPIYKEFSLSELDSIGISREVKISVNKQEILKAILENQNMVVGPLQDKDYTFYIKIENIVVKGNNTENLSKETVDINNLEKRQAGIFYEYIIEQYKNRGKFQLYDLSKDKIKR
ncbi:MAG: hypothetical protein ACK4UJ_07880 [Leptonema sp. (in: bacteria)]